MVVEVEDEFPVSRDEIVRTLQAENVLARRYFWPGCHNMLPYRAFYPHAGLFAVAEYCQNGGSGDRVADGSDHRGQ